MRKSGFTDQQRRELVEILAEALTPNKRDIALMMSTPTMKKEINELRKDQNMS